MSKLKSKKFWISLAGTVIMIVQLMGVKIDAPYVTEVVNAICAVCVVIGLLDGDNDGLDLKSIGGLDNNKSPDSDSDAEAKDEEKSSEFDAEAKDNEKASDFDSNSESQ